MFSCRLQNVNATSSSLLLAIVSGGTIFPGNGTKTDYTLALQKNRTMDIARVFNRLDGFGLSLVSRNGRRILVTGIILFYIEDAFMLAHSNFSSQQPKKKEGALLLHHRFKVFPITQPVFPICGIVWL